MGEADRAVSSLLSSVLAAVACADERTAVDAGLAALAAAGVRAGVESGTTAAAVDEDTLVLPLVRGGRRVGTLTLPRDAGFDDGDAAALASVFALALPAGAAPPESLELLAAGLAAGAASSFDDAVSVILEACRKLSGADGATLVVWNEARDAGVLRAGAGTGAAFVGEIVTLGDNVASRAITSGRPVVIYGESGDGMAGHFATGVAELACSCSVPLELDGVPLATVQAGWVERPTEESVERAVALLQTLGTVTGVAARAQDERAQARDLALLEAVLEAVGEAIWVHTDDRQVVNAAARNLLGLAEGEELDAPAEVPVRALDGTPLPREEQPSVLALRSAQPQRFRNRASRRDGVERIFDGTAAPVVTPSGGTIGVVMSFRDVTEEHTSALLKDRLLERLFENLPTAVAVFEPDTFETRSANRAFLELVGRDSRELIGSRPPYPWWPEGQSIDPLPDELERFEWVYRRGDGALVPVDLTRLIVRSERAEPLAIVVLATDLSERRRFEQQLVQTGKLAAIGELAAGVAHEINNPLFAILGLVEFLLKDAEPGSKAANRLQLIEQTGLEIKEIVRALLDFARERTDELSLVSLSDVARQTVDLVRRATSAKGIEIVETYPEDSVPVEASATQLKQVILNLLTNAQHAQPDGGSIRVEVRRDADWAIATIADLGPGLTPELAARIFDPFFTTKRELGGTGLGLSVSLGIAQMHGGDLAVASVPGQGATFTLRIPLASAEAAS